MIQFIQPQTNYPIARLVQDLGDGVTYYAQAVIRNALTNATIATVNLTNQGASRLYSNSWFAVQDSTGRGLYITISTTVYTDSGYTVKAVDYGVESDTYVVYNQYNQLQFLATQLSALLGAESQIDYKKIKKIVLEAVAKVLQNVNDYIKFPEQKEVKDYTNEFNQLAQAFKQAVAEIELPEAPEYTPTDLTPVHAAIKGSEARLHKHLEALPKPEPVDLNPITERLGNLDGYKLSEAIKAASQMLEELQGKVSGALPEVDKYLETKSSYDFFKSTETRDGSPRIQSQPSQDFFKKPVETRDGSLRI